MTVALAASSLALVLLAATASVVAAAGARLAYAKLANPRGRVFPLPGDGHDYGPFLRALRASGYRGPIGMETPRDRLPTDGPRSVAFLRGAWAAAKD